MVCDNITIATNVKGAARFRICISSGAKAHLILQTFMYELKPVPFETTPIIKFLRKLSKPCPFKTLSSSAASEARYSGH